MPSGRIRESQAVLLLSLKQEAMKQQILSMTDWTVEARIIALFLHHAHLSQEQVGELGGRGPLKATSPRAPLRDRVGNHVLVTILKHKCNAANSFSIFDS